MRKLKLMVLPLSLLLGVAFVYAGADDTKESELDIKKIMLHAHKEGLMKKVAEGESTREDKEQLLRLYVAMWEAKPPKGEMASWHEKSGAAIVGAAKVLLNEKGAKENLKTAVNCGACHKAHKP